MLASLRWLDSASARAPTEEWFASIRYRSVTRYTYTGTCIQYKSYCDGTSTLGLPKARSLLVFPWEHSTACVDMTTVHAPPFGIRPTCWLRARGRSWSPPSLAWSPVSSISSIVINRN